MSAFCRRYVKKGESRARWGPQRDSPLLLAQPTPAYRRPLGLVANRCVAVFLALCCSIAARDSYLFRDGTPQGILSEVEEHRVRSCELKLDLLPMHHLRALGRSYVRPGELLHDP